MENVKDHWENVFSTKQSNEVSWTQSYPHASLNYIKLLHLPLTASIIDVGGGDSNLVVHLLDRPIIKNTRAEQILSDKQVEQLPYIDINKLSKNTINKAKGLEKKQDSNFVLNEPKNDKKENNKNYTQYENDKSLLDLYDFKDVKKL